VGKSYFFQLWFSSRLILRDLDCNFFSSFEVLECHLFSADRVVGWTEDERSGTRSGLGRRTFRGRTPRHWGAATSVKAIPLCLSGLRFFASPGAPPIPINRDASTVKVSRPTGWSPLKIKPPTGNARGLQDPKCNLGLKREPTFAKVQVEKPKVGPFPHEMNRRTTARHSQVAGSGVHRGRLGKREPYRKSRHTRGQNG
jgi:hypothetical protein